MSDLAIPEPSTLDLATVGALAEQLVAWAETTDDIAAVRDAAARWGAITEYVRRTSREGVAEAEGALRRLEVRIGLLLGPPEPGGRGKRSDAPEGIGYHARSDLRALAEHADVVEQVIAESDDANPPSRRKCLTAISRKRHDTEDAEFAAKVQALDPAKVQAAFASDGWQPSGDRLTVDCIAYAVVVSVDDRGFASAETFGPFAGRSEIDDWADHLPTGRLLVAVDRDSVDDPLDAWWLTTEAAL